MRSLLLIELEMERTMNELMKKICDKSESIGRWREFLDKLEDWSSPWVVVAQGHIKRMSEEREELIKRFYNEIDK